MNPTYGDHFYPSPPLINLPYQVVLLDKWGNPLKRGLVEYCLVLVSVLIGAGVLVIVVLSASVLIGVGVLVLLWTGALV